MNLLTDVVTCLRRALAAAIVACCVCPLSAQSTATGTIEGRVLHPEDGKYLELARISVEGTSLETLSDAGGRYRLSNVPTGSARVKVFRTGFAEQTQSVQIAAGGAAQLDFSLSPIQRQTTGNETVKLDRLVVSTSKEISNDALAINTQRFAPNQMNVVAADEFGGAAESKVGEVLKSIPGVSTSLGDGGEPYQISLDGVPAAYVPVTVGGFTLASSSQGTLRNTFLNQFATNTISRIEVLNTPTPESSGAALAGSVNMVPLSAFERAKPLYVLSTSVSFRDDARSLKRTPGPGRDPTYKIRPGFEFTGIVPVNKRFGFTVSASASTLYRIQTLSQSTWRGAGAATNGGTLPDTTPDKPYLSDYAVRDGGAMVTAANFGTTFDYQLSRNDQLSFAFQWGFTDYNLTQRMLTFLVNGVRPGDFSTTFTRGIAGAGAVRMTNTRSNWGGNFYMPALTYRHNGPVWQAEAGLAHSQSGRWRKDGGKGRFFTSTAQRTGLTVSFDDNFYLQPGRITVADGTTGAAVDPYQLEGYRLTAATTNLITTTDLQQTAYANVKRSFSGSVPLTLKTGIDVRRQVRDHRAPTPTTLTFVGRDGRANTADDTAVAVQDRSYVGQSTPYGFPSIQWTNNENLWDLYQSNPGYFTENSTATYTAEVAQSRYAEEYIYSTYLRGDTRLFDGRLKLVGGVRAEQTNTEAQGRLLDPTRNFQRDASGKVLVAANGTPLPIRTDPLEAAKLTNLDRGLRAEKEYLRLFPSLNASFGVTDNLIARAGYYWSVGRPNFAQYGGSVTLPNTENPPAPNNRIVVNNAGIKAWTARTTKVSLEYYFEPVGLVSVTAFQRDYDNMFGSTVIRATPEFLGLYNLDPELYGAYDVSTQYNLPGTVKTSGVSFNYKQALTFLPEWARGVRVFANGSAQRVTGDVSGSFNGYTPRMANWGVSLSRPKYTLRANWNYTGKKRLGPVAAGRSIGPGTYNWNSKRLVIDVNADYVLSPRFSLFALVSNLNDDPIDAKIYGPDTPLEARFNNRQTFGALWSLGIKGRF
jgi:TonB-dependent receptor